MKELRTGVECEEGYSRIIKKLMSYRTAAINTDGQTKKSMKLRNLYFWMRHQMCHQIVTNR